MAWRGSSPPAAPLSHAPHPPHRSPKHSLAWEEQSWFHTTHGEAWVPRYVHTHAAPCRSGKHVRETAMAPLQDQQFLHTQQLAGNPGAPSPADPVPSSFPLSFYSPCKASITSLSPRQEASWEIQVRVFFTLFGISFR